MKLPNSKDAVISNEKIIDYILSETHPVGKFKARLFQKFGFNNTNANLFEKSLRKIAKTHEVTLTLPTQYGTKYLIDGEIKTPLGKPIKIRCVWIIEINQNKPRFITAYPV